MALLLPWTPTAVGTGHVVLLIVRLRLHIGVCHRLGLDIAVLDRLGLAVRGSAQTLLAVISLITNVRIIRVRRTRTGQ